MQTPVSLEEIRAAQERLAGVTVRTPTLPALALDVPDGIELWLKAENLQRTGAFKLRGAYNAVASLPPDVRVRGVITYSSGNHGQAVACAAHLLGVPCVVTMPEDAIAFKVEATRRWGAGIVFAGHTSLERERRALELAEEEGYSVIPPFDDPRVIAGQGTVGLEIVEQVPDLEAVVVQVGGGGLISGVATAVKALRPGVEIIGVEPEGAADARESFESGRIVTWDRIDTVADGLRTSRIGQLNFESMRAAVDRVVTVSEEEILSAVGELALRAKLVTEPSGAVATAAVLSRRTGLHHSRTVAVISGGNVAPERLMSSIEWVAAAPTTAS